ncbi:type I pullulanase [Falsibacillus pallidus]|uniref:pullulanase n=1 Tax=Falsibacillus pallidus TaxID=493781 RepID=A0A370GPB9_9BACI|nr:type I pullulanase [Falsibacillus pallidus]RDI45585.1 pullulanase [Falsibacillus pallidus]
MGNKFLKSSISMMLLCIMVLGAFLNPQMQTLAQESTTKVIIHYQESPDNQKDWNLWVWPENGDGSRYEFTGEDAFGKTAEVKLSGIHQKVGFIVRTDSWEKDGGDRWIDTSSGIGEVWVKAGDEKTYTSPPDGEYRDFPSFDHVKVKLHYHRYDQKYDGWNLWMWNPEHDGQRVNFTGEDSFGKVAELNLDDADGIQKLGFIVRKSVDGNDWSAKDIDHDRFITRFNEDGTAEVWLVQGQESVYQDPGFVDLNPVITQASMDGFNQITLETNVPFSLKDSAESIKLDGAEIEKITPYNAEDVDLLNKVRIFTKENLDLSKSYKISMDGYGEKEVVLGKVIRSKEFDDQFYYDGWLGNQYQKNKTDFTLWAPTASEAHLVVYKDTSSNEATEFPMKKGKKGTWTAGLKGDQDGLVYTYKVKIGGAWTEAVDPYVRAATINGDRGVVVNLDNTNPKHWNNHEAKLPNPEDAIIYEAHVRDLSISPDSGIEHKGKFLGMTDKNTKGTEGNATGLSYIKKLGVTHVQFLPIFDFNSVDETKLDQPQYNWGYDPKNYNVPEGSYSTDPADPYKRITELKSMIQALHDNQLRVIMDVVYNHVFNANQSNFQKLVPGYYFRFNEDGSFANGTGVGNDTASERKMMRKFIVDSVSYWAKEYHMDGFRFDLMGIHDTKTMNEVRHALNKIDPSIIVLGEGWDLNTPLDPALKADQKNAEDMPGVAHFNDSIRDAIKGSVFDDSDKGFVNGKAGVEDILKQGIEGGIHYPDSMATYRDPEQVINYAEAHDNLTLWDKLQLTNPESDTETLKQMHKLASSILLTSEGIPFIQAGQEFMRTKNGDHNSYQSPDSVNQLDWNRAAEFHSEVDYFKGLIDLRKHYQSFRMTTAAAIEKNLNFMDAPDRVVAYSLNAKALHDKAKEIVVIHNANEEGQLVSLPQNAAWHLLVDGQQAGVKTVKVIHGNKVMVPALSTFVLKR